MSADYQVRTDVPCAKLGDMPMAEYEASPREVRNFAYLQMALTAGFLVLLFLALDGTDADLPPWWVIVLLLGAVAVAAFFAERVWLQTEPLDPAADPEELRQTAVGVFAAQTVRRLAICEAAVIFSVIVSFVGYSAAWPIVIGGVPGLLLLVWETWPGLRNASISEAMLEADGAESGLVESFREW